MTCLVCFYLFDTQLITKLGLELAHYFVYVENPGVGALKFHIPQEVRWDGRGWCKSQPAKPGQKAGEG